MTKWLTRAGALVAVTALSISVASAGPDKKAPKKPAAAPKCSACKMDLTTKKDKTHTVAVKIKGKTYYCCADCPMNKGKKK